MRILFLSFYFEPDLCAGSFRATPLLAELSAQVPEGAQIDLVTTLPNRYKTFREDAPEIEQRGNATIYRVRLSSHSSDVFGQSKAFLHYWHGCNAITKGRDYDLVFATSSRLMTAFLASRLSRRHASPFFVDVRDIFVDTISDIFPRPIAALATPFFNQIERLTFGRASVINLVSEGFRPYFEARYPGTRTTTYTNGIDSEFLNALENPPVSEQSAQELSILYAGNIGEGQCLHTIVPALAKALVGRARIKIIGDGGRRPQLENALNSLHLENVQVIDPMSRSDLIAEYLRADVLFLHLGAYQAFEKVLPSKIFEYAAVQKPVLAGVAGYAANFIEEEVDNAAIFPPGDVAAAVEALASLRLQATPRPDFVRRFARKQICQRMAQDIIELGSVA